MISQPEFDVIIVGSGVAGALIAHRLVQKQVRVLILEAGGLAEESLDRYELLNNYTGSASKATDAPFCGDNWLAQQPDPRNPAATNYYYYPPGYTGDLFKSFYERIVGGSTWHWQGIYVRMLPADFAMDETYHISSTYKLKGTLDWPIRYSDVEPYYVQAEREMGVAGSREDYANPRFKTNRMSRPYPMRELPPSFLDEAVGNAVGDQKLDARVKDSPVPLNRELVSLRVTPVPHAINSEERDGRPACEGRTSCVPLCPIKARYEAVFHVQKALRAGAILRKQAVVRDLQFDDAKKRVVSVRYTNWTWSEDKGKRVPVGGDQYATGRIVVLAANGIENPMILMRSKAAPSSGAVLGAYLMDHPIKQSFGLAPSPLYPYRGPQTTSQIEGFRHGDFRKAYAAFKISLKNDGWSSTAVSWPRGGAFAIKPDGDWLPGNILQLVGDLKYAGKKLRTALAQHAWRQITLNSACEQLPIFDNRVSLGPSDTNSLDELGLQRPQIAYRVLDNDGGYVRRSFEKVIETHARVFDLLHVPKDRRVMLDGNDKMTDNSNTFNLFLGSGHIMGTTRMAKEASQGVVDREGRAFDHPNLFVVGSSIFPTSSTANPTSTVAALALRAADSIERALKTL
jgi:glucose dehydrogenase